MPAAINPATAGGTSAGGQQKHHDRQREQAPSLRLTPSAPPDGAPDRASSPPAPRPGPAACRARSTCLAAASCRRPPAASRLQICARPLQRKHDQIAAFGDHAGKEASARSAASGAGSALRQDPNSRLNKLVRHAAFGHVVAKRQAQFARKVGRLFRWTADDQNIALGHARLCGSGGPCRPSSGRKVSAPRSVCAHGCARTCRSATIPHERAIGAHRWTGGIVPPASARAGSDRAAASCWCGVGSSRSPNSTTMAMQPMTMGIPTSANSK